LHVSDLLSSSKPSSSLVYSQLEEKYAAITGKSLFGGESGKSLAKFVEVWSNTELGGELRPLIFPGVGRQTDDQSQRTTDHLTNRSWPSPTPKTNNTFPKRSVEKRASLD
jgi:hypothetical protein